MAYEIPETVTKQWKVMERSSQLRAPWPTLRTDASCLQWIWPHFTGCNEFSLSSANMPVMCLQNHWTFSRSLPTTQGFSIACQVKWRMRSSDALSHWSTVTKGSFDLLLTQRSGLTSIRLDHVGQVRPLQLNMAPSLPFMNKKLFTQNKVLSLKTPHRASCRW